MGAYCRLCGAERSQSLLTTVDGAFGSGSATAGGTLPSPAYSQQQQSQRRAVRIQPAKIPTQVPSTNLGYIWNQSTSLRPPHQPIAEFPRHIRGVGQMWMVPTLFHAHKSGGSDHGPTSAQMRVRAHTQDAAHDRNHPSITPVRNPPAQHSDIHPLDFRGHGSRRPVFRPAQSTH